MPVSGHEETGVKSFAGQFNDFVAGVPIKKRRFPIIRPSSPLSEEPSSLPEDTESLRKEHSSTSQGSTLSNASIAGAPIKKRRFPSIQAASSPCEEPCSLPEENDALRKEHSSTSQGSTLSTSSSGLSNTNKNPISEERKASSDAHALQANKVQSNPNYLRPKLEEPNLSIATQSCTLDVMASKEKVVLKEGYDEKLGSQITMGKSDLLLAAREGLALNLGGDINKQNVEVKCKQENLVVPESTDLSLGLKKSSFPSLPREGIEGSCQRKDEAEAVSLKLSLSKEEGSSSSLIGGDNTNSDRTHVQSIRANWDLNTTMDAWEETASNAASGKTSNDGLKSTGSVLEKQFTCSTGMVTPDVDSERQTCLENENRAFTVSSTPYCQQYRGGDKHNLCLTSSGPQKFSEESSRLSAKLNSVSTILMPKMVTSCDTTMPSFRIVKTEPVDENLKQGLKEANPCLMGSIDSVTVKREIVERSNPEAFKSSSSNLKSDDPKLVKTEPTHDVNLEQPKTAEDTSDQLGLDTQQGLDNCSSPLAVPMTLATKAISALTACPSEKPVCSTEMITSANVAYHPENSVFTEGANVDGKAADETCAITDQVSLETVATAKVEKCTESSPNVPVVNNSVRTGEENVEDPDGCRLKLMDELPPGPRVSGEGCVSDDEMITLSGDMLEDYGSDYESDDNHALTVAMDRARYGEEDDYEDGEVREPLQHSTAEETIFEVKEVEHAGCSSYENKLTESGGVAMSSGCPPTSSHTEEIDNKTAHLKTVTYNEIKTGKDGVDAEISEESDKVADKIVCVGESFNAEKPTVGSDVKRVVKPLESKSSDVLERKIAPQALEKELSSDQATNGGQGVDVAECADEVVKKADMIRKTDSDLPMKEASSNTDDVAKDINNGGNQGRIINLSRATGASFPGKTRAISGRSVLSRAGRDILSDALDGDKLHRGRDEYYIDGPRRFSTERHQDLSPRNSRLNFGRGRGRVTNRIDTRGDWDSDRDYSGEFYNGPSHFRVPRHKYASNIADADMEYNNIAPDGFVGTGRLGRKVLNDEGPLCRHIPSRRRSPGGRDVPAGRGIQMGHRIPRDMSPNRCIGGSDGSEMVGMRHNEKFMGGFAEDNLDPPMFTRPQQFGGLDGRFPRGNRNFSSIQRRNIPRIRSKSPIRSRSRSPGPWSSPRRRSPRRRSPDGFGGHPEVTHRRSPLYRPDRPVFPRERVVRRNGSPSYMSRPPNDIRDIDSGRDHGHPRSVISRSPGRMLLRNRRFDVVDPRDRSDNDEYFGGPMPSGRMLDLEGNGDERRFERRGPVRTFRPPYNNGAVGENFHLNSGDGPRHYRFCTDDDSDFHERGNLRERDFDRRIKNSRPTNGPPRRTRNIDDQEANYRHGGGQVWSDDGFDDMSRMKRKRF